MGWWRRVKSPVRPVEQAWIDQSMDWFVAQFGSDRLHGDVVLPTDDYFPGVYRGTRDDVRAVVDRLCAHMGIDPARVKVEHEAGDADPQLSAYVPVASQWSGAAGDHRLDDEGRSIIGIRDEQADDPTALVATVAHELGHVLLLGDGRISSERKDHEPLTDLLTVFFGLGIFSANAALQHGHDIQGQYAYSRTSRLGYLTEPMYGYGLARYAWSRGETEPEWAKYLDTNPRAFLDRGLRYLRQTAGERA